MNEELVIAIDELRQRSTEQSWFIPVLLDQCELPDREIGAGETLRSIQHVTLFDDWGEGIRKITSTIRPKYVLGKELRNTPYLPSPERIGYKNLCAVDFGTSYSCISVLSEKGEPVMIPSDDGRALVPSVICFETNMDYVIGCKAEHMSVHSPEAAVFNIKRLLGTDEKVVIRGEMYSPEVIAGLILSSLRKNAEEYLGQSVQNALVSVPGNFSIKATNALVRSYQLGGFKIKRLIGEPNAASIVLYEGLLAPKTKNGMHLILDLGGGTFDASVIYLE